MFTLNVRFQPLLIKMGAELFSYYAAFTECFAMKSDFFFFLLLNLKLTWVNKWDVKALLVKVDVNYEIR